MLGLRELPKAAWKRVVFWTIAITLLSVAVSDLASIWLLDVLSQGINGPGLLAATAMPILLGGPMVFYQTLRHQQLKLANERLDILASTDPLTECLNRRAFAAGASRLLEPGRGEGGTLLVIDADHFKTVNDRFGHEAGDAALQLVAGAIRAAVRKGDLVGRLGGEEFGVYLPGADVELALTIAERIRRRIRDLPFAPDGVRHALSVSIGGASAAGLSRFSELFRAADKQLYDAKNAGRDRIELMALPAGIEPPANSNDPDARKTPQIGR